MEYLPGLTLAELVERHGPLPPERVIYLIRQVCGALGRSPRPWARFIVTSSRATSSSPSVAASADFVKLLDFGLVKSGDGAIAGHVTQENVIAGSPLFMSPEQSIAGRKLDGRSDLYSLGAVAYFLLTGQPPFSGESTMEIIVAHARDDARPPTQLNSEVPRDLEGIVLRCLAKDREARFPDADELDRALAACESAGRWSAEAAAAWWSERLTGAAVAS